MQPMDEKEKAFWRSVDGARHGAYRCNDCRNLRSLTMLPATINGVTEPLTDDCFEGLDCYECKSTNLTILFNCKDANEALAYFAAIEALENK